MPPPGEPITVFIENEAGTDVKHHYDEETLRVLRTERVGAEYPYPYGFVPGTLAPDGDAADCFVLTENHLVTGATVRCVPVALLEQTEGGETDHDVLAVPIGEPVPDIHAALDRFGRFFEGFMAGVPGREAAMGRLLPEADAREYLDRCAAGWRESGG
jgi:inorganic pyrophosphatase